MEWMLLPYKRYVDFSGRSQRKEYWMFYLFTVLVNVAISIVFGRTHMFGPQPALTTFGMIGSALSGLFALFNLLPSLAVAVRRLHDTDRSGWWFLLIFLPILGWIALLVFFCQDGTPGANRFGEDPKGRGLYGVFN